MKLAKLAVGTAAILAAVAAQGAMSTAAYAADPQIYKLDNAIKYVASGVDNTTSITYANGVITISDTVALVPGASCWYPTSSLKSVSCDDEGITLVKVYAGDGNDTVRSYASLDVWLLGQVGNDTLVGGGGDDILDGDAGHDRFFGGAGRDGVTYYGYTSNVTADIDGVTGDDGGFAEDDTIGTDVEDLYGGNGDDTLTGDDDANLLQGNSGDDTVRGGAGNDNLAGSAGLDALYGEEGNDRVSGGTENDLLYGDLSGSLYGAGEDTIYGGDGADVIWAGSADDRIEAGNGDDTVHADGGNDIAYGEAGDDDLRGSSGVDFLYGGDDNDRLDGGYDNDYLNGGAGGDECVDVNFYPAVSCE